MSGYNFLLKKINKHNFQSQESLNKKNLIIELLMLGNKYQFIKDHIVNNLDLANLKNNTKLQHNIENGQLAMMVYG